LGLHGIEYYIVHKKWGMGTDPLGKYSLPERNHPQGISKQDDYEMRENQKVGELRLDSIG